MTIGINGMAHVILTVSRTAQPSRHSLARLGMTYIHIPVNFQNPTDQDFDQFCAPAPTSAARILSGAAYRLIRLNTGHVETSR